jgi:parvulin-like peptidyl-prolyl isomerase
MRFRIFSPGLLFIPAIIMGFLAACTSGNPTPSALPTDIIPSVSPTFIPTETPVPPSPTPVPLVATVNGETISEEEFNAELERYLAAHEDSPSLDEAQAREIVLNDLINQILLAQAARAANYSVDDQTMQERMGKLVEQVGGEQVLQEWIETQGYRQETFEMALRRSIEAAWMSDQILAKVPETAEQVHARQILTYDQGEADQALRELKSGKDFATLLAIYDPVTLGELGWFPRGYLVDAKLDEAAFSLQPDEFSEVIETQVGFHILQVLERDPNRVLQPDARLILQEKALQEWVETQREQSEIVIFE